LPLARKSPETAMLERRTTKIQRMILAPSQGRVIPASRRLNKSSAANEHAQRADLVMRF
jgi:hypothetical protein